MNGIANCGHHIADRITSKIIFTNIDFVHEYPLQKLPTNTGE